MNWQQLIPAVMDELHGASEGNSCIMAAAVLLDVLRAKGIKGAYPLTVKVQILNPKFTERLSSDPFPRTAEEIEQWRKDNCAMVAIGHGDAPSSHWPAHLVVIIPKALNGKDALCDLTIGQASVPAWDIVLGPTVLGVRDIWITGLEDFGKVINGCRIIYRAFPDDQSFKQTPLWKPSLKRELIVKKVRKKLKDTSLEL